MTSPQCIFLLLWIPCSLNVDCMIRWRTERIYARPHRTTRASGLQPWSSGTPCPAWLRSGVSNPGPRGLLSCMFRCYPAPAHLIQINGSLWSSAEAWIRLIHLNQVCWKREECETCRGSLRTWVKTTELGSKQVEAAVIYWIVSTVLALKAWGSY